jgi:hypothetical protein
MRIRTVSLYPATLPVVLAAAYTWFAIAPQFRLQSFVLLSMTAVGATELVLAAISAMRQSYTRIEILSHVLVGVGALVSGYAFLDQYRPIALSVGALLFTSGLIARLRSF